MEDKKELARSTLDFLKENGVDTSTRMLMEEIGYAIDGMQLTLGFDQESWCLFQAALLIVGLQFVSVYKEDHGRRETQEFLKNTIKAFADNSSRLVDASVLLIDPPESDKN